MGKYIQLGDKFYRLDVARDGAFVRLSDPENMNIGTVAVSGEPTLLSAGGANGLFFVPVIDGKAKLPCGKYRLNHWELDRKDSKGFPWKLVATGLGSADDFRSDG